MIERMTRSKMAAILRDLATKGTDLRNGYVVGTLDLSQPPPHPASETAADEWAEVCRSITCISVWPDEEEWNCVRFDDPGQMHPAHHAPIIFAPAALEGMDYDQIGQLARKCDRLIIVEE